MGKLLLFVFLLAVAVACVVLLPLGVIWSLNTLFGLKIAYTLWTWLAALLITAVIAVRSSS
jgi:hypothetical protein